MTGVGSTADSVLKLMTTERFGLVVRRGEREGRGHGLGNWSGTANRAGEWGGGSDTQVWSWKVKLNTGRSDAGMASSRSANGHVIYHS